MVFEKEVKMDEILKFILSYCSFLYQKYKFKFIDSEVSDSFGNAFLTLTSETISIRFIRERGQLVLDFQSNLLKKNYASWYSFEIVRQFITNEKEYYSIMNEDNAKFLENNFEKIKDIFSVSKVAETVKEFKKLEKKRAKKLFG